MKKIMLSILVGLLGSMATANDGVEANLKLERSYLEIADTLAQSHNQNGACGPVEAYTEDMVRAVRQGRFYFDMNFYYNKKNNRKFKISAASTKALASTLALKEIMNMLDEMRPETFEHALNRVKMWGPAPGVYGNMSVLTFAENNKATLSVLEILDDEPYVKWVDTSADFTVSKNGEDLIVTIQTASETLEYILRSTWQHFGYQNPMWEMVPVNDPDANPFRDGYVDYPSECDA